MKKTENYLKIFEFFCNEIDLDDFVILSTAKDLYSKNRDTSLRLPAGRQVQYDKRFIN